MKYWKRIAAFLTAGALVLGLAAFGSAETAKASEAEDAGETADEASMTDEADYDFDDWTIITNEGIADQDVDFYLLPDAYNEYDTEHKGTDVVIHYTTDVYGDGVTYDKFCRVYLPYGYDPDDTETKYNVIYFQHGNAGSPNELFDHDMQSLHAMNLLNNIFDPDHQLMEPCIIVCPTYYLEYDEDSYITPGDNPAGDGGYEGIENYYYLEVVQDLIPAVESQFNVYCEDFSPEGIAATRDHRAWAGYSRGSMCTWYMFNHDLEYFEYFIPMSAPIMTDGPIDDKEVLSNEEAYDYLKEAVDEHPDLDFFIFATAGGPSDGSGDISLGDSMQEQINYLASQTDTFSFGLDPEENNLYFTRSEFFHNDLYMPYSLVNAAQVLFKDDPEGDAAAADDVAAEDDAAADAPYPDIPAEYTKVLTYFGTYGFGDAEITIAMSDDDSQIYYSFICFDEDQIMEGTVEDGVVDITYDLTGFVSGDAQQMYEDALASGEEWVTR